MLGEISYFTSKLTSVLVEKLKKKKNIFLAAKRKSAIYLSVLFAKRSQTFLSCCQESNMPAVFPHMVSVPSPSLSIAHNSEISDRLFYQAK